MNLLSLLQSARPYYKAGEALGLGNLEYKQNVGHIFKNLMLLKWSNKKRLRFLYFLYNASNQLTTILYIIFFHLQF